MINKINERRNPSNVNGCSDHDGWAAVFFVGLRDQEKGKKHMAFGQEGRNGVLEETKKFGNLSDKGHLRGRDKAGVSYFCRSVRRETALKFTRRYFPAHP